MKVGVISDTHGLLRPQAVEALLGSQLIIHAGDVGDPDVLEALRLIAPVYAIRGNVDKEEPLSRLPNTRTVSVEQARLLVIHDVNELGKEPVLRGVQAVIFGHSHRARLERRDNILFLNPGSAGPQRFKLPVTLAWLNTEGNKLDAQIIELPV